MWRIYIPAVSRVQTYMGTMILMFACHFTLLSFLPSNPFESWRVVGHDWRTNCDSVVPKASFTQSFGRNVLAQNRRNVIQCNLYEIVAISTRIDIIKENHLIVDIEVILKYNKCAWNIITKLFANYWMSIHTF